MVSLKFCLNSLRGTSWPVVPGRQASLAPKKTALNEGQAREKADEARLFIP